jgi:hypothetical protein
MDEDVKLAEVTSNEEVKEPKVQDEIEEITDISCMTCGTN